MAISTRYVDEPGRRFQAIAAHGVQHAGPKANVCPACSGSGRVCATCGRPPIFSEGGVACDCFPGANDDLRFPRKRCPRCCGFGTANGKPAVMKTRGGHSQGTGRRKQRAT